jgi:hypothetical protein
MLREQLDQATAANQSLTNDIHKLTNDWQRAREELETKEADWREEEQVTLMFWFYGILRHFQQYFSYIMAVSFIGGGNQRTRRKPPTCRKLLTNLITSP